MSGIDDETHETMSSNDVAMVHRIAAFDLTYIGGKASG
jgi:hypothetical protein